MILQICFCEEHIRRKGVKYEKNQVCQLMIATYGRKMKEAPMNLYLLSAVALSQMRLWDWGDQVTLHVDQDSQGGLEPNFWGSVLNLKFSVWAEARQRVQWRRGGWWRWWRRLRRLWGLRRLWRSENQIFIKLNRFSKLMQVAWYSMKPMIC